MLSSATRVSSRAFDPDELQELIESLFAANGENTKQPIRDISLPETDDDRDSGSFGGAKAQGSALVHHSWVLPRSRHAE